MIRKNGLVAFVDILGYSSLMELNDVGEQLSLTLQLISSIPEEAKSMINSSLEESKAKIEGETESEAGNILMESLDKIKFLVISDSILVYMEIEENKHFDSWAFMMFMSILSSLFMRNGLPLRGAISYGEFITVNNSFAGKPIINSYKKGNSLNMAGIVFEEKCHNYFKELLKEDEELTCIIPLLELEYYDKKNELQTGVFIDHSSYLDQKLRTNDEDLIIEVTSAFTAHNKQLNAGGKIKLKNTIQHFRSVIAAYDNNLPSPFSKSRSENS